MPPLSSFCFAHWHCSRIGLKDACTLFIKRERPQRRPQRTTALRPRGRGRAEDGNKEALRHACAWPRGRTWPRPRPTRRTHLAGADVAGGTFYYPKNIAHASPRLTQSEWTGKRATSSLKYYLPYGEKAYVITFQSEHCKRCRRLREKRGTVAFN